MFLAFEGIDGAGKSTQALLLCEHFERLGRRVSLVREPGGTALGEELRRLVLDPRSGDLSPEVELFLFMAARAHLCRREIEPALERGEVVVSDRFLASSVVYQGIAGGIGVEEVLAVGRVATRGLEPDLTIVLDVAPGSAHAPLDRGDRMERRGAEYQSRVRAGFRQIVERFPARMVLIDGAGRVEEVHRRVLAALDARRLAR
jgi:dTMP kinase